jgi:hypothetical protein
MKPRLAVHGLFNRPQLEGRSRISIGASQTLKGLYKDIEGEINFRTGKSLITHQNIDEPIDNLDPSRRRASSGKRRLKLIRVISTIIITLLNAYHVIVKIKTEEEKVQQAIFRAGRRDGIIWARQLEDRLAELGFYHEEKRGKIIVRDKVRYGVIAIGEDGNRIILHVDHFPIGVAGSDLVTDRVLTELARSCRHPVSGYDHYDTGVLHFIERGGSFGVPDIVKFRDVLPEIPASALPLTIPVGISENGRSERYAMEDIVHMVVAGETGGGKSNMQHVIACTIIARNKPEDVRLMMIDMKFGGVELGRYEGIPHLITLKDAPNVLNDCPLGVARDLKGALALLRFAYEESVRRGELFEAKGARKIDDWNKKYRAQKLPRIVLFIDEMALLLDKHDIDNKEEKAQVIAARNYVKLILRLSRASGVHIIGATQNLDKSVMSTVFKVNIPGRICFSVSDVPSSILVINTSEAVNLRPAGRAIFKHGVNKFLVQTPWILQPDIDQIITNAKANKTTVLLNKTKLSPEELIDFAVTENSNTLDFRPLFRHFGNRIEKAGLIRLLTEMDGNRYDVGEFTWQVVRGRGSRPRSVVRVERSADIDHV